ncbi:hypothetical protein D3C84_1204370 [compost metagenome]
MGRVASEEIRRFLQSEKLRQEFLALLSEMTIELKAEIRLVPRGKDSEKSKGEGPISVTEIKARPGRRKKE